MLQLRGYWPGSAAAGNERHLTVPQVVAPGNVTVTGIIRLPTDLTLDNLDAPSRCDLHRVGRDHRDGRVLPSVRRRHRQLRRHLVPAQATARPTRLAFEAQVQADMRHQRADRARRRQRHRGGLRPAEHLVRWQLALLVLAVIVGLALASWVVGQSLVRQVRAWSPPTSRRCGRLSAAPRQLTVAARCWPWPRQSPSPG